MRINTHGGHNPPNMIACGAVGILNESAEDRKVNALVIKYLQQMGHTVYDCTCNNGTSQSDVLNKIITKCNSHTVDLDVSIHFNAGGGYGTEVLVYNMSASSPVQTAKNICAAISELGFRNRGVKTRPDLAFLRGTRAPALLIECCFVDSQQDANRYDPDSMAKAIVKGITGQVPSGSVPTPTPTPTPSPTPTPAPNTGETFQIKPITKLTIVKDPSAVTGSIKDANKYTITDTTKSKDGDTWGKLKSGAGWINISSGYVQRV